MQAQGRILHRQWGLYDTRHVVYKKTKVSPNQLEEITTGPTATSTPGVILPKQPWPMIRSNIGLSSWLILADGKSWSSCEIP